MRTPKYPVGKYDQKAGEHRCGEEGRSFTEQQAQRRQNSRSHPNRPSHRQLREDSHQEADICQFAREPRILGMQVALDFLKQPLLVTPKHQILLGNI